MLRYDGQTGRRLGHPVAIADPLGLTDFAAFTPDGRGLLTAARDPGALAPSPDPSPDLGGREIVVRDPRTLRPLRRFPGFAQSGALSPDGRTFAAGDADGSVHFLDLRTGRQRTALGRHTASVDRAQFTADGRFLITSGEDAAAIVWNVKTAAVADTFEGHAGRVAGLAVDRSGQTLYTAAADGTVITWDLAGRRRLGRPFDVGGGSDRFPSTALSRDGRTLVSTRQDGAVSVVDTRRLTSRRLAIVGGPSPDSPTAPIDAPSAPAFGPDGTLVVAGFGRLPRPHRRPNRRDHRPAEGHRDLVLAPSASADGRIVVAAGWDGTARLWDRAPAARSVRRSPSRRPTAPPPSARTAPRWRSPRRRPPSRCATSARGGGSPACASTTAPIGFAAFSRDGGLLLAGSGDGHVRVFSTRDWRPTGPAFLAHARLDRRASTPAPTDGRSSPPGQDGQVRLWDARHAPADRRAAPRTHEGRQRRGPLHARRQATSSPSSRTGAATAGTSALGVAAPGLRGGRATLTRSQWRRRFPIAPTHRPVESEPRGGGAKYVDEPPASWVSECRARFTRAPARDEVRAPVPQRALMLASVGQSRRDVSVRLDDCGSSVAGVRRPDLSALACVQGSRSVLALRRMTAACRMHGKRRHRCRTRRPADTSARRCGSSPATAPMAWQRALCPMCDCAIP